MSIIVRPYHKSPSLTVDVESSTWDNVYTILGTNDEAAAINALMGYAPLTRNIYGQLLAARTISLDVENYKIWRGKVNWKKKTIEKQPLAENQSSFQFETGGGNTHITHALKTISQHRLGGGTPSDFKQAIGWNGAEISGCDIVSPTYTFSETHAFSDDIVTQAYKLKLFRATGKTNKHSFKGFAGGEVLFLGASGSKRGDELWEINYRFVASENITGIAIGGITGVAKKGWDYLWVHYVDDTSEDLLIKKPEQVNVEKVYEDHDYANLGIGT